MKKNTKAFLIFLTVAVALVPALLLFAACPPTPYPEVVIDGVAYVFDGNEAHVAYFVPSDEVSDDIVDCVVPATVVYDDQTYPVVDFEPQGILVYGGYARSLSLPASFKQFNVDYFDAEELGFLQSITVDEANPDLCSVDGVLFSKDKSQLICFPVAREQSWFELPEETTSIPRNSGIYECETLQGIAAEGNEFFSADNGVLYSQQGARLILYPLGKKDEVLHINATAASVDVNCNLRQNRFVGKVQVDSGNPYLKAENNVLLSKDGAVMFFCPELTGGYFAIPDGVSVVAPNSLPNVLRLFVPASVTVILDCVTGTLPVNLSSVYFEGEPPLHCSLPKQIRQYTDFSKEQFAQLVGVNQL